MSFSGSPNIYMDDELFLADCTSSQNDKSSNDNTYPASFINHSKRSSTNCNTLAYFMLKSLLLRLLYNRKKYITEAKGRALFRWKCLPPESPEQNEAMSRISNMVFYLKSALALPMKRHLLRWAENSRTIALYSKYDARKHRREEAQSAQLIQINRVIGQLQIKQNENDKNIENCAAKEKKYRETIEEMGKSVSVGNGEISKYQEIFRKLEIQNENLKDKLEAVENNVTGFIREMSGVLVNNNEDFSDDDGMDDFPLKSLRKKR